MAASPAQPRNFVAATVLPQLDAMNTERYETLRQAAWRRPLSAAEQAEVRAWLMSHPEAQADWAADSALNAALRRLPDFPVPSNFTARVLQAVARPTAAPRKPGIAPAWLGWPRWWPRLAIGTALVAALLVSIHAHRLATFTKLRAGVALLSETAPLPAVDALVDFDSVRTLGLASAPDTELLTLLQ